jgi:hypothetical protein
MLTKLRTTIRKRVCGVTLNVKFKEMFKNEDICWLTEFNNIYYLDGQLLITSKKACKKYDVKKQDNMIIVDELFPRVDRDKYVHISSQLLIAIGALIAGGAKTIVLFECDEEIERFTLRFKEYYLRFCDFFNNYPNIFNYSEQSNETSLIRHIDGKILESILKGEDIKKEQKGWQILW